MKFKIASYIDSIQGFLLIGWIWNVLSPDEHLQVELWIDGTCVTNRVADQTILKLSSKNEVAIGHHFSLYIPREYRKDGRHKIQVKERSSGQILGSAEFQCQSNKIKFFQIERSTVALGELQNAENNGLAQRDAMVDGSNVIRSNHFSVSPRANRFPETDNSPVTFFSICSKNFTAYAITLFDSIKLHHPNSDFVLFLCDDITSDYKVDLLPFRVVSLAEMGIPDLQGMSQRYNITEFNTAIKPFAFSFLFEKLIKDKCVYIDPDILVISPLDEVVAEFEAGAECILTPHILKPAEHVETSDIAMLVYGIYNLGFIGLRNTPTVINIVEWWGRRLERDCRIDLQNGLFVDQKWADLLPAFIKQTSILHHSGYNVAYWNLSQRTIEYRDNKWYSNAEPLRFVHFSGNEIGSDQVFSRHSQAITRKNIGDLNLLLDYYRQIVYANGHLEYSKLVYSYSWNGESGTNLHAPEPTTSTNNACAIADAEENEYLNIAKDVRKVASCADISAFPKLLFIDWSTPRPDRDAGSITAFHLMAIYVNLGYEVTFIPSDLLEMGEYTKAVRALGIRCLHVEDIGSVRNHLMRHGREYDFAVLCRAPIAELYVEDIREFSPKIKIILNTSDLHYLREIREAEISCDTIKLENAYAAKAQELDTLRRCDVTIVMSSVEEDILKIDLPDAVVKLIPLMFVEPEVDIPTFESRQDILFIGGFPHTPNVDAVIYFCNEIFPLVREVLPEVKFHIIGNAPTDDVLALAEHPGVVVHGYVKDIAPLFRRTRVSVAPLRYGAGIKGKIGTSMVYGVPVVATSIAAEGMHVDTGTHIMVADNPREFAAHIVNMYRSKSTWDSLSRNGLERMLVDYSPAAGQRRISQLMREINPNLRQIDLHILRSAKDFSLLKISTQQDIDAQRELENSVIQYDVPNFYANGFCATCRKMSTFNTSFMYAYEKTTEGKSIPNWREHLDCSHCGFVNRVRAAMHLFYRWCKPTPQDQIYITEQTTHLFRWLKDRQPNLVGSEYLGGAVPLGQEVKGIRNEDMTQLTFPDESFDHILSFDVLEHVSDDIAAFAEVYRCLKPGGIFLFTAPFSVEREKKLVRARLRPDGSVEHFMEPEFHGNPVDEENGALCFRYFAWDMLDDMKEIGFKDPKVLHYWSSDFSYLGVDQILFLATK